MAQESDKNKKSSRNFSLEKTKKRSFDLEKEQPADVVTPTEESVADNVPSSEFPEAPDTGKPMKMTWIWICSAIVLIVIVIACIRGCESSQKASEETVVEQVAPADDMDETASDSSGGTATEDTATEASAAEESAASDPSAPAESVAPATNTHEASAGTATAEPPVATTFGDIEAEAIKVIRGDYGNGDVRKSRLGANYSAIQAEVNRRIRR